MYYRRDILAGANISVPVTWDEFLDVAKQLHGKDMDGDGRPDYGVCLQRPRCASREGNMPLADGGTAVHPWLELQGMDRNGLYFRPGFVETKRISCKGLLREHFPGISSSFTTYGMGLLRK